MRTKPKLEEDYVRLQQGSILVTTKKALKRIQKHHCHKSIMEAIDFAVAEFIRKEEK